MQASSMGVTPDARSLRPCSQFRSTILTYEELNLNLLSDDSDIAIANVQLPVPTGRARFRMHQVKPILK